jgi:outer membrane protein OmpA-like peptidoglycan-associated protein
MLRKSIFLLPLFLFFTVALGAQTSSKSKSKDRFRERSDHKYPVEQTNTIAINKEGTDVAPIFYENGLLFVSARGKNSVLDPATDEPYRSFYYAPFDPNGDPAPPSKFEFDASKKSNLNDGGLTFSRDFKEAYFTRTNNKEGVRKAGKDGVSRYKIYLTKFGRPDWTPPVEMPFNSNEYSCVHPSLSADATKLFFASDMPGGQGGFDIYVVERTPDGWSAPRNLGPQINTEKQEVYPFVNLSGTLFFASDGRANSLGGYDNYFVNNPLTAPEEIVNLGEPFNSEKNDYSLIMDEDGKNGFFASNREKGYGKDDIYRFQAKNGLEGISKPLVNPGLVTVIDAKTGKPLQGASIHVLQPSDEGFVNGKDFYTIDLLPVQDKPNALSLQLVRKGAEDMGTPDLISNAEGKAQMDFVRFKTYLVVVSKPGMRAMEQLRTVDTEDNVNFTFKMSEAPPCLRASGTIAEQSFGTRIANATIKMVHKVNGHTETVRSNLNGQFDICLPYEGDYVGYVTRDGFTNENFSTKVAKDGLPEYNEVRLRTVDGVAAAAAMPLANGIMDGSVIVMDNIFYEYEKTTLNQKATRHLDALFELLKGYPDMEIELISHTDTRGDARLNMELTEERAKNAKTYLTHRGIESNRVASIGKGETEPRNECKEGVECTDQQHLVNNRLEIRIVKMGLPARRP